MTFTNPGQLEDSFFSNEIIDQARTEPYEGGLSSYAVIAMLFFVGAALATKALRHEVAQRKPLVDLRGIVSLWRDFLNTLLHHYAFETEIILPLVGIGWSVCAYYINKTKELLCHLRN